MTSLTELLLSGTNRNTGLLCAQGLKVRGQSGPLLKHMDGPSSVPVASDPDSIIQNLAHTCDVFTYRGECVCLAHHVDIPLHYPEANTGNKTVKTLFKDVRQAAKKNTFCANVLFISV